MTIAAPAAPLDMLSLDGAGLRLAARPSEPLPIRRIQPAPCTEACPAGINVKAYTSLIAERRFAEAVAVVRQRCPLPGICGRVCHHPCEAACERGRLDDPIAIRALKRFVADYEREHQSEATPQRPPVPTRTAKVAVIGSGPAGLTAAHDLRRAGYPVTVFEAESEPGGMLRYGIVEYRLPRDVLDHEIDVLVRAGIDIRTGVRLGADLELEWLLGDGYKAVVLAVGAQRGRRLGVPGEEGCPVVEDALAFLRRVNNGERKNPGRRVVVLGGGSTAIEAARTARRLGAQDVEIVYRRTRKEMPAGAEEIEAAEAEGVRLRFLVAPTRVLRDGDRFEGLECLQVALGEPDRSGRRRPIPIPGSEFLIEADRVLGAIGQEADLGFLSSADAARLAKGGRVAVDPDVLVTERPGVYAAGDVVTGPATVIEAIAAGHRAARSIRRFIEEGATSSTGAVQESDTSFVEYELPTPPPPQARRIHLPLHALESGKEFEEAERAFTLDEAVDEARRCLRCGPCSACLICAPSCRRRHVLLRVDRPDGDHSGGTVMVRASGSLAMSLEADGPGFGEVVVPHGSPGAKDGALADEFLAELSPARVRVAQDRCRGCGSCVEVCPFDALRLRGENNVPAKAQLDDSACRGCGLCTAVCPSKAISSTALSPAWWADRLREVKDFVASSGAPALPYVVAACESRAGAVEMLLDRPGIHAPLIRFRCLGQMDVGMFLELFERGTRSVLLLGCDSSHCRFQGGAVLARQHAQQAQTLLGLLGAGKDCVIGDWADGRAESLDRAVRRFVGGQLGSGAARPEVK